MYHNLNLEYFTRKIGDECEKDQLYMHQNSVQKKAEEQTFQIDRQKASGI